ncbi:MAG: threonine/serine exporter ThrE family protein [Lysobacterales bacterium]
MNHYCEQCDFVIELARRLHEAGSTAPRLEDVINSVSRKLGLDTHIWSSPTAIIATVRPIGAEGDQQTLTRVVRLAPGDIHLRRLWRVDDIAERVARGEYSAAEGMRALAQAAQPDSERRQWLETVFGFLLASAGVAGLLKGSPADIVSAAALGLMLGVLAQLAPTRPRLAATFEALAAFLVALMTAFIAYAWTPISPLVLTAGLIVLLPGLSLTTAAAEVATQHLVSGTARFAGAVAVLLKLAFGALLGSRLAAALGWSAPDAMAHLQAPWVEVVSLVTAATAFALLFKARIRDWWVVFLAAGISYLTTRFASPALGAELGLFIAAFIITVLSNLYARWSNRPGATFRLPGLILLVPGSVGFRSLTFVFEKDVFLGLDTAFSVVTLIAALVAGLLLGNSVVPPRAGM